jgi:hypothetical protein
MEKTWVPDRNWVVLPEPRQCRHLEGHPAERCPNIAHYGLMRKGAYSVYPWPYCEEHMYGRKVIDGVVCIGR